MAPELNYEEYSYRVDVFAYAVTVYATFTDRVERTDGGARNHADAIQRIARGERLKRPPEGNPNAIPDRLWQLIEQCWEQVPRRRLTFQEIVEQFENPALWIPGTNAEEFLEYRRRIMPGPCPPPAPEERVLPEEPLGSGRRGQTLTELARLGDEGAIAALDRGHRTGRGVPPQPFRFSRKS
jgi:hypothetical protein